jgi:aryl-alcohol dehydrogenase-like predicted oxidoreductase
VAGLSRLGLGTVQFGMTYGVTNARGRVAAAEVAAIIGKAAEAGISVLDTAPLYGDSEAVLGRASAGTMGFRVVSKTLKFAGMQPQAARGELRATAERSLERIGVESLHGLIFHDSADLLGPAGDLLWSEMERLRGEGLTERIGLSVYSGDEIDRALERYPISLVQLPFNPVDRRLVEGGQLQRLRHGGVEVHARSLFLQGLLLQHKVEGRFAGLAPALAELDRAAAAAGLDRLSAIFAAAFAQTEIDHFVCGVTSATELEELIAAAARANALTQPFRFASTAAVDERILNPARWSELERA